MNGRIIILGMFRSGTSITARLVQSWGAYAGAESELFGDRYGYLEHLELQKLNDELMDLHDRVPPVAELLLERSQDPHYRDRALQLLDSMDRRTIEQGSNAWVWKDPRMPMLLPFWTNLWGDAIYVITVRHPIETILSGADMEGVPADAVPFSAGLLYWQHNMLSVLTYTQGSKRKIFVPFDRLTGNPSQECARLIHFLDGQIEVPPGDAGPRIMTLTSQVEVQQHHFHEHRSLAEIEPATREQRALYDFLRVKIAHPDESFNAEDFSLYPGWREYLQVMDALLTSSRAQES